MSNALKHRCGWWLRQALALGIFLQGALPVLEGPAALASRSGSIVLGVTVGNNTPPAPVSDLLVSPILTFNNLAELSWTAPQGNVNGVPFNNWPVALYHIHYATFSVDS